LIGAGFWPCFFGAAKACNFPRVVVFSGQQSFTTMKTLAVIAIVAAPAALAFTALNFDIAAPFLFAAGLCGLMVADYTGRFRPARMSPAPKKAQRSERFGLVA
jgi:hypothetical protein